MEDEAFFLFVAYTYKELPARTEGGLAHYDYALSIRRAGLRKPDKNSEAYAGFHFKRVHIDFDPTNKQIGYVVVLHTKIVEEERYIYRKDWHFPAITETEEEAEEIKKHLLEKGECKAFLVKGQQVDKIEIEPILISEC